MRKPKILALGGGLLLVSGVLAIIAFAGTLISTQYYTTVSVIGGILATLSDVPIAYYFLYGGKEQF